jgi:hypothetical protein
VTIDPSQRRPRWISIAVATWLLAVAAGMLLLWRYKAAPGRAADGPARWPAESKIRHTPDRATLVMFAHPHCPCTKASLEELEYVMSRVHDKVDATVLFIRPQGVTDDWTNTATLERAREITGVSVLIDDDGKEASRFGSWVSGQVLLYDASGALMFAGGITGSRGHIGDNIGRERLLSFIQSGTADAPTAHVYGCDLFDHDRDLQGR